MAARTSNDPGTYLTPEALAGALLAIPTVEADCATEAARLGSRYGQPFIAAEIAVLLARELLARIERGQDAALVFERLRAGLPVCPECRWPFFPSGEDQRLCGSKQCAVADRKSQERRREWYRKRSGANAERKRTARMVAKVTPEKASQVNARLDEWLQSITTSSSDIRVGVPHVETGHRDGAYRREWLQLLAAHQQGDLKLAYLAALAAMKSP